MGSYIRQAKIRWRQFMQKNPTLGPTLVILAVIAVFMWCTSFLFKQPDVSLGDYRYKPESTKPEPHLEVRQYDMNLPVDDHVLILTPMAQFRQEYWDNLLSLSFDKSQTDLGFIIPRTRQGDDALKLLQRALNGSPEAAQFNKITILRQDQDSLYSQREQDRHAFKLQKVRRSLMAQARNSLLITTLGPQVNWVLWLDSDIVESPATLLEDMMGIDKPVLAANCFQKYKVGEETKSRPYDFNNWAESDEGLKLAQELPEDEIILEGYSEMPTYRALMGYFYNTLSEKKFTVVPLDGVGGTCLLVKAEVHRDGANFPTFPFHHLIETEGFAHMAKKLGYEVCGLPNYLVYHVNE